MSQYEENYVAEDVEYYKQIPTDAFLAGILFCKNRIDFLNEYSKLKEAFEKRYQVEVIGQENLAVNIVVEGTNIRLADGYDKIIFVDGKPIDVRSYLYSVTSDEVREYFGIKEQKQNTLKKYYNYFFGKKGRK